MQFLHAARFEGRNSGISAGECQTRVAPDALTSRPVEATALAHSSKSWQDGYLPDEYGKRNSVFRRYRRWVETGVFEAMLETLAELVERDRSADKLKNWRRVATRYDKTREAYLGFVAIAAVKLWIPFVHQR